MKGKPTLEEGDPTGVEKEPTGLARRDIVRRDPCSMLMTEKKSGSTLTGVVPSGESHPEVGEEEKSCRPGERVEWERGEMRERRGCEGPRLLKKRSSDARVVVCCILPHILQKSNLSEVVF